MPVVFQNVLTALNATTPDPIGTISGIALSGYDASHVTGQTFMTFTGAVNDVGFVDNAGAAFDGDASGLMTTDGIAINLFTYASNNNVLLGRRADNGNVVFAAYAETLKSDGTTDANVASGGDVGATSAKLWLVQYETLSHLDGSGNPIDLVTLSGLLNLGINTLTSFDATNAPSGNNLFMMLGDGSPAAGEAGVVVTGETPANQSDGFSVSSGDTVNTSKGGGDTTIGTDNQMIVPDKGLYFTFVKLSADSVGVTVPNLDHGEAVLESNIKFDTYLEATGATFTVVQLQPPKAATLTLTAIENADLTAKGATFIDDILNYDATEEVNIFTVTVTHATSKGTTPPPVTFTQGGKTSEGNLSADFADNKVILKGLVAGDTITYGTGSDATTPLNHNRLFVENTGNATNYDASFDIGGFQIASGSLSKQAVGALDFYDDVPTADVVRTSNFVTLDETLAANAAVSDTNAATDDITATNADPWSPSYGTAIGALSGVDLVDTNNSTGNDSVGATSTLELVIDVINSGLTTTGGATINLYKETDGTITGRAGSATDTVAFAIGMDGDGKVSVAQYLALHHTSTTNPDDQLNLSGKLSAKTTVTDGDKDVATDTVDIGAAIRFDDDGPSIAVSANAVPTLTTDDTGIPDTAGPTSFLSVFATPNFGTDGFKDSDHNGIKDSDAVAYALGVSATGGVDSGLDDTVTGRNIFLFLDSGGVVNGRVANASNAADASGAVAFSISVNSSTAAVTLTQSRAIVHNDPNDPVESGLSAAKMTTANLITLNATVTDGDGDTASTPRDITAAFAFEDDGPSVAFGNLIGTGTIDPQTGYWTMAAGNDTLGANGLDIALTGVTIGSTVLAAASFSLTEVAPVVPGSYLFNGSMTGDFDNIATTDPTTVHFSLTAYADHHYSLDLVEGFATSTTTSTLNGGLGAGGPDPVQTLYIPKPPATPTETVVFFSAKPDATDAQILDGVVLGATDKTEAQLEAQAPTYIDPRAMNVSTSGIGVANNLLEGDTDPALGSADESFVVNPLHLLSKMTVKIDNSVSGYSYTGGERLYYEVWYDDGSTSGDTLVTTDLGLPNKGQDTSFDINTVAGKLIDAVQLTMYKGEVKVPEILFTTATENLANNVKLDFLASVSDKDGDTATDAFSANLYADQASGAAFNFVLPGTTGVPDAFNVDLALTKNKYQVTGFETGSDKLVLLGDATSSASIDNSGSDSIVTVSETGGQTTTVTVVGVNLAATDVAGAGTVVVV